MNKTSYDSTKLLRSSNGMNEEKRDKFYYRFTIDMSHLIRKIGNTKYDIMF